MNELALRFHKQRRADTVFVSWVKDLGAYCEIDFSATMSNRGNGIVYVKSGQATPLKSEAPASATQVAEAAPRTLNIKRIAKGGLARARRFSPRLAEAVERRAKLVRLSGYKKVVPADGDVIFISWGEWWDPNFIDMLRQAKQDRGAKIVQVIHDLGPILTPQFSSHSTDSLLEYCREVVPICDLVLVVSQSARKEITTWLQQNALPVPKVEVFRNGDDFTVAKAVPPKDPQFKEAGLEGRDYIMMVGTVELRKNHLLFYYVYKLAKERGIKLPKLIIVGRLGWKSDFVYDLATQDPDTRNDILFFTNTSDEEMSWLYDHCLFTVHAAFYEGWGIPVAESIARGVPCLCTNADSVLEIAGDDILNHYSAASPDECLAGIQRLSDPKTLAKARERTKKYKQTTWDDSFKQIDSFIKEIL